MKKNSIVNIALIAAIVMTSFLLVFDSPSTVSAGEPSKFKGVMAWGNYRGHVSILGFDTQGTPASGSGNTWDGQNPFQFNDVSRINQPVDWRTVKVQLDGVYASDISGYWHDTYCPGLTIYYDIDPQSVDERYVLRLINTTGRNDLSVYWQSRLTNQQYEFKGRTADLQVYIPYVDEEGYNRINTCAGLVIYPR